MLNIVIFLFTSIIIAESINDSRCLHSDNNFQCVEYLKNYDGDTVRFNIPNVHAILGKDIPVRISGIDTPEIKTKDMCEKEKALKAKEVVERMLISAKRIDLKNCSREKYFRLLCNIVVDGESVGDKLLKLKLAYPYSGKTKEKINWCLPLRERIPAEKSHY